MTVLLTGAVGFTAKHLVKRLRQEPNVVIAGCDIAPAAGGISLDSYFQCDIGDARQMLELIARVKPDWVFHLAGLFRGTTPDIYRVNLLGAVNLLDAVKTASPNTSVLLVGSAAEYGIWPAAEMPLAESHECRPVGAYALSKYAATLAARDYFSLARVKVVVARPFNLVGAGVPPSLVAGAVIQRAKTALAKGESSIVIGNVDSQRDFISIEDAVDAYVKLLSAARWGEVFNICSGVATPIQSVLEVILSFAPRPMSFVQDPELLRANENPIAVGNPGKASEACGFTPSVSLRQALRSAWDAA